MEVKTIGYYQKLLDKNYQQIKDDQKVGIPDWSKMQYWVLTVDENEQPKMTTIADVEKGIPIYADGCKEIKIDIKAGNVSKYRYDLRRWLDSNSNLLELKEAALKLKQNGKLGVESTPEPDYNMSGLTREQCDSQAWQNYVIENGLYRPTIYDDSLERLLKNIELCLEFYEKAMQMVDTKGKSDE